MIDKTQVIPNYYSNSFQIQRLIMCRVLKITLKLILKYTIKDYISGIDCTICMLGIDGKDISKKALGIKKNFEDTLKTEGIHHE